MVFLPLADLHHFCLNKEFPKNSFFSEPSNWLERHLTVFCIDQTVHGFVVYYPNIQSALFTILTSSFYRQSALDLRF